MNRRTALTNFGILMGLAAAAPALSDPAPDAKAPAEPAGDANPYQSAIDASFACQKAGGACAAFASERLAKGDTTMANCLASTRAMAATCAAFALVASVRSPSVKKLAAACAAICRDCEKACRVHEAHHAPCRACAATCATCAAECEKIAA